MRMLSDCCCLTPAVSFLLSCCTVLTPSVLQWSQAADKAAN